MDYIFYLNNSRTILVNILITCKAKVITHSYQLLSDDLAHFKLLGYVYLVLLVENYLETQKYINKR